MRLRAKIDGNQALIVRQLRAAGVTVQSLAAVGDGCPDLLCGYQGRNFLLEVKPEFSPNPKRRTLTEHENIWHENWRGQVVMVKTFEEALKVISGAGLIQKG